LINKHFAEPPDNRATLPVKTNPSFTLTLYTVGRNSKYQLFLQMSELPVRRYGTLESNTA